MRSRIGSFGGTPKKLLVALAFARSGGWGHENYDCDNCRRNGYHVGIKCRKWFPGDVGKATRRWIPEFQTRRWSQQAKSHVAVPYHIEEAACDECPVSYITPESIFLTELLGRNKRARECTGAAMFGQDSGKWPAWWADAVDVYETFHILEANARTEAER